MPQLLDSATALAGTVAEEPGGLFYSRQGEQQDALVVSSSRGAADFHELVVEPNLDGAPQDIPALLLLSSSGIRPGSPGPWPTVGVN